MTKPKKAARTIDDETEDQFIARVLASRPKPQTDKELRAVIKAGKPKHDLKPMEIVVFDPLYAKKYPEAYKDSPVKLGEHVLYLGDIPNCSSHCAVANYDGKVIWMMHPLEFRRATEDEL
jgi:hypothetical protein